MTKRGGVYFFEMWVRKPVKGKGNDKTNDKSSDKTQGKTDKDGDTDMNEVNKKIGVIEQMLTKLQEGFTRQGIL